MHRIWPYLLIMFAGIGFYIVIEDAFKAVFLVIATILIDIGLDKAIIAREKRKGNID